MVEWPDSLVEDVAHRRAIFFHGAGVSKSSVGIGGKNPPGWQEFLEAGVQRLKVGKVEVSKLLKENDYLSACEIIKDRLDGDWFKLLQDSFTKPKFKHNKLHEELFRLDLKCVITQNFDKLYDTYAQATSNNTIAIKHYYDTDLTQFLRNAHPFILKAHGSIDSPEKMIFTREEFANARHQYGVSQQVLDALLMTNTFVFIGCSLKDPDIQLMLERCSRSHRGAPPHYLICPKKEISDLLHKSLKKNFNLSLLEYDPTDKHSQLVTSVSDLVSKVEAVREAKASLG